MTTQHVLDKIRNEILMSGRDRRYKLEAYSFVMNGLNFYYSRSGEKHHFTGQELSRGFIEFAQKQYGPIAYTLLSSWGISKTEDFGYIIYNLISINLVNKNENDTFNDFKDVLEIRKELEEHDYFTIDRDFIKTLKGA